MLISPAFANLVSGVKPVPLRFATEITRGSADADLDSSDRAGGPARVSRVGVDLEDPVAERGREREHAAALGAQVPDMTAGAAGAVGGVEPIDVLDDPGGEAARHERARERARGVRGAPAEVDAVDRDVEGAAGSEARAGDLHALADHIAAAVGADGGSGLS